MPVARLPFETKSGWFIRAPAKLNVYLDVLGRRADGFHDIRTLLTPVRLYDDLFIKPYGADITPGAVDLCVHSGLPAGVSDPAPVDDSNLVTRALRALWDSVGVRAACQVRLVKRIPSQAGLGGGSSDAAAALLAANHAWNLGLGVRELEEVAARVGSDVPGLLHPRATLCEGRGERVTPIELPAGLPVVIAKTTGGLSTAQVYQECRSCRQGEVPTVENVIAAFSSGIWEGISRGMTNRLQAAALRLSTGVERLRELFSRLPLVAHQMTGSGSAYFGICRSWKQASSAAAWLRSQHVPWVMATATC